MHRVSTWDVFKKGELYFGNGWRETDNYPSLQNAWGFKIFLKRGGGTARVAAHCWWNVAEWET